jgi:HSP20 family protein
LTPVNEAGVRLRDDDRTESSHREEDAMIETSHLGARWPSLYEPFRNFGSRLAEWVAPVAEASMQDNTYRIAVELPGVAEEDITLTVKDGLVTVHGEKRTSHEEKGETWYFSERQFGSFSRSFRLPPDAEEAAVRAEMKDGVLTVSVPKSTPETAPPPKRIPIARG